MRMRRRQQHVRSGNLRLGGNVPFHFIEHVRRYRARIDRRQRDARIAVVQHERTHVKLIVNLGCDVVGHRTGLRAAEKGRDVGGCGAGL